MSVAKGQHEANPMPHRNGKSHPPRSSATLDRRLEFLTMTGNVLGLLYCPPALETRRLRVGGPLHTSCGERHITRAQCKTCR